MTITLNGKRVEMGSDKVSILDLVKMKGLEPERVVVEYNFEIPNRECWDKIFVMDNDNVEVLKFVGGG